MKTLQGAVTGLFVFAAVGFNFTSYAQTQEQSISETSDDPLATVRLVPQGEEPLIGTYYRMSDMITEPGESLFASPPYPGLPPGTSGFPVYAVDSTLGVYIVDDSALSGSALGSAQVSAEIVRARILNLVQTVQSAAADRELSLSASIMTADSLDGEMTTMESGEGLSFAEMYSSDDLWLEMISKTNTWGNFVIHPPAAESGTGVYDLFMTTNLSDSVPGLNITNWIWLLRTSPGQTNVAYSPLTDEVCFFRLGLTNDSDGDFLSDAAERLWSHTDPLNGDENTNGIPDGWEWLNFGNLNQAAAGDYDGDGMSNAAEYGNGYDPNTISFSLVITNEYFNLTEAIVPLNVITGVPSSVAVVVDGTNFSTATWNPSSSSAVVNLGSEGWHDVWIGLRGRLVTSEQTWKGARLKLDTTPPALVITNPTVSLIAQPMIQLQGYSPESLAGISYDLTNAAGLFVNQSAAVLSQFYDTNLYDFTTNFWQAFDIPLTNGENVLTLRAADWAGNVTTTNLIFTVDYSSKTNPPVVNLVWPQNNTVISGTNYTWHGWVDDFTAKVIAKCMDTNGVTNIYSASVERDGNFWIENLPLASGTNALLLEITDAAGNTASTNISISKSLVALSFMTIPAIDPEQPFTDIHGTVASNYTVWVNGIKAQVAPNGTWTATNVPVGSGGLAVFSATAISNDDNGGNGTPNGNGGNSPGSGGGNPTSPSASNAQRIANKLSKSYLASYEYKYSGNAPLLWSHQRRETYYGDGTLKTWYEAYSPEEIGLSWRIGSAATETRSSSNHTLTDTGEFEPNGCDNIISWPVPSSPNYNWEFVNGTETDRCYGFGSTSTNVLEAGTVPAMGHCCSTRSVTDSDRWYSPGDGYLHHDVYHSEFKRTIQSTIKFFTGGKGIPGSSELYILSANAFEDLWKTYGDDQIHSPGIYWGWYRGLRAINKKDITIGSFGAMDDDGKIYVTLAANTTVDITPKVKGVDYYEFGSGAEKYQPRIYFNGTNITGATVPVVVGQKIALTCVLNGANSSFLPANGRCKWTVPGYAISNYIATVNSGVVYSNFPTASSNVVFYWVDGGSQTVSVEAGQSGSKATADFTVYRPSVTFTDLPPSFATNAVDPKDGTLYLQLGFEAGTGSMQFEGDVQSFYKGKTDFRQLVNRSAANGNTTSSTAGQYWLDNILFYTMRVNDGTDAHLVETNKIRHVILGDSPSFQVAHSVFGNITSIFDQFKTYLMFRPDNGNVADNIFVPIGKVTWAWSAATTYSSGSWSVPTYSVTRPIFSTNSSEFPVWPNVYGNN